MGTPPEGRYTRDRAKPEFWSQQRFVSIGAALTVVIVIAAVLIAVLR